MLDMPDTTRMVRETAPGISLHVGDFRKLSPQVIADESVQLVFTEPPVDACDYDAVAEEAARILKVGGSLMIYLSLVDPFPALRIGTYLKYWTACIDLHQPVRMDEYGVISRYKMILWYVKAYRWNLQSIVHNAVRQENGAAEYYIRHLTSEGGLVADFFAGRGTTLAAAQQLGRQAVGFEIDPRTAATASIQLRRR
jgi:hypothetical protein